MFKSIAYRPVLRLFVVGLFLGSCAPPDDPGDPLGSLSSALAGPLSSATPQCNANLASDPQNCGTCGVQCDAASSCVLGRCVDLTLGPSIVGTGGPAPLLPTGTWTERGPFIGGRLDGIDVVPGYPGPFLTVGSPGGGAWTINDYAGSVWTERNGAGLGDYSFVHLERDVIDSTRLYGMTWNNLFVTTDSGGTWTQLGGSGSTPGPLQPFPIGIIDPKPFAQLKFSSTQRAVFYAPPCTGIRYSFDGTNFTTWYPFSGGEGNPENCIGTIAADPSGRVYFSSQTGVSPPNIYRTCPWAPGTPCTNVEWANGCSRSYAPPTCAGYCGTAPTAASDCSAMTSVSYGSNTDDLVFISLGSDTTTWRTTDGGCNWQAAGVVSPNGNNPRALVYPGPQGTNNEELFQGNTGSYYSHNRGDSWSQFVVNGEHADKRAIAFNVGLQRVYAATDGSSNTGAQYNITGFSWIPGSPPGATAAYGILGQGLHAQQAFFAGVVSPTSPPPATRRVFAGTVDNGANCSSDSGQSWTTQGAPGAGDVLAFAYAPSHPDRAYVLSLSDPPLQRTDNARAASCSAVTWSYVNPGGVWTPKYWHRNTLTVDPTNYQRVAFINWGNVAVSLNGGSTLTSNNPVGGYVATSVYIASTGTIYAGTEGHGAYSSIDNGRTWQVWGLNTGSPALILGIRLGPGSQPTAWMATTSGLYRKLWGGSWAAVLSDSRYIINDVEVDPACATRVYAAYGFVSARQQHRGGIVVSTDNGGTWTSITAGYAVHNTPIADVEVDAADPAKVYAASFGRGFWTYNWGTVPRCY